MTTVDVKVSWQGVVAGLAEYLDHPRCVALGEIGFNNITPNEERAFVRQLQVARTRDLPVIIHLPHVDKLRGAQRIVAILRELGMNPDRIVLDHNTEESMPVCRATGCYCGMTVYPISKLTPQRVSDLVRQFGSERMFVNGSADWGISDPLSLVKVVTHLVGDGHPAATIQALVYGNAMQFYGQSPKWKPDFSLIPVDPQEFQR